MAKKLNALSDAMLRELREWYAEWKRRPRNGPLGPPDPLQPDSPDAHIVKLSEDERLDAVDEEGIPGVAQCDIYELIDFEDESENEASLQPLLDGDGEQIVLEAVYNYTSQAIANCANSKYFVARRNKSGAWIAEPIGIQIYKLTDCRNRKPTLYVTNGLGADVDKVAKYKEDCYKIECADNSPNDQASSLTIDGIYSECKYCNAIWKLTECETDPEVVRYTSTDLYEYDGKVIKITETADRCWTVSRTTEQVDLLPATFKVELRDCLACDNCYQLENCLDPSDTMMVDNDLAEIAELDEDEDGSTLITNGYSFEIEGACYKVIQWGPICSDPETPVVTKYYKGCAACGCVELIQCDPTCVDNPQTTINEGKRVRATPEGPCAGAPQKILANRATDADTGDRINLRDLIGEFVRLEGGKVYEVKDPEKECKSSEAVVVLEHYKACADAKCYKLVKCGDATIEIETYTDLKELGYEKDEVIRLLDGGDVEACWTIVDDSLEWDAAMVSVTDDNAYHIPEGADQNQGNATCNTCGRISRYSLTNECHSVDCGDSPTDAAEIVTDTDFHRAVGKWVKVEAICYQVTQTTDADTLTEDTADTWSGPYDTCSECLSAPVNAIRRVVRDVFLEGTTIKLKVDKFVFEDGKLVNICSQPDETVIPGTECV